MDWLRTIFTPERIVRWLRRFARLLLIVFAFCVVAWLLWRTGSALLPFVIGVVLAYLLLPIVDKLDVVIPRWLSIVIVYIGSALLIVGFVAYVVPPLVAQASQVGESIPAIPTRIEAQVTEWFAEYERLLGSLPAEIREPITAGIESIRDQTTTSLRDNITNYVQNIGRFLISSVVGVVQTVAFLLGFLLIPFWLFYVLMDQHKGKERLNSILWPRIRADFWAIVTITDRVLSGYIRGQIFLGLAVGSAAGLGLMGLRMFGMDVRYILLLAVIAGFTELIPIIGPVIGAIPAVILGFFDAPTTGVAVLVLYVVIQQLENSVLVPRIVGDSVGLHPAILMVLLVVYSQVFGLIGAILSAPVSAVSRDVFSYMYGRLSEPPKPAGQLPERLRTAEEQPKPVTPPVQQPTPVDPTAG